ncbi:hypothetical protein CLV58_11024 [Spirosoma oryzae]|uniref:Uncharacterized protein n=1 Tax=Spirosoma oryzae TaxID=1469603 RepID=A0A2T0SVX0_9BACT|nr:hypothetical protein [Spirosoma oryzae]PRY37555.1 hypothetical protein CLV58_11024 [Spirosoma oryzae]
MKIVLLLAVLIWALPEGPVCAQWRLLVKSQDVFKLSEPTAPDALANPITLIEPRGELSKYLIVRYAHSKRALVRKSSVWGFADSTNAIWRVYKNDLCRVTRYNDTWVEYGIYRSKNNRNGPTVWYEPGFSRGLDGKIWNRWSEAMADALPGHIVR